MLEPAIDKIKKEMDDHKDDPYITVIGNFMIQYLQKNPDAAPNVLTDERCICKSLDEMERVARQKSGGKRYAVLTDDDGFAVVLNYYGITVQDPSLLLANNQNNSTSVIKKTVLDLSLDELLKD